MSTTYYGIMHSTKRVWKRGKVQPRGAALWIACFELPVIILIDGQQEQDVYYYCYVLALAQDRAHAVPE